MFQEKEALWAKVILNKYYSASRRRAHDADSLPSSPNWQAIKLGFSTFAKGIGMRIGNGEKTSVWYFRWVKGKTLKELIEGLLPLTESSLKVADLIQNKAWNWNLISFDLPQAIKDSIKATPIQIFNSGEDSIIWSESKDGEFSTNFAYRLVNPEQPSVNSFQGSWIWKIDMLPKIVHFMWLCHHNSISIRSFGFEGYQLLHKMPYM